MRNTTNYCSGRGQGSEGLSESVSAEGWQDGGRRAGVWEGSSDSTCSNLPQELSLAAGAQTWNLETVHGVKVLSAEERSRLTFLFNSMPKGNRGSQSDGMSWGEVESGMGSSWRARQCGGCGSHHPPARPVP